MPPCMQSILVVQDAPYSARANESPDKVVSIVRKGYRQPEVVGLPSHPQGMMQVACMLDEVYRCSWDAEAKPLEMKKVDGRYYLDVHGTLPWRSFWLAFSYLVVLLRRTVTGVKSEGKMKKNRSLVESGLL